MLANIQEVLCKISFILAQSAYCLFVCAVLYDYIYFVISPFILVSIDEGVRLCIFFLSLFNSSQAVRLVADLCLDNNINDPQLWNSVLQQLLAFGMVSYIYREGPM